MCAGGEFRVEMHIDLSMRRKRETRREDDAIARLATLESGIVTRAQLLGLGLSPNQLDRRIAAGRLRPVYRGVYALGHDALPSRGRLMAALLAAGPGAALSHRTAAARATPPSRRTATPCCPSPGDR